MRLYLLTQERDDPELVSNIYLSCVVVALNMQQAKLLHPDVAHREGMHAERSRIYRQLEPDFADVTWPIDIDKVKATFLGKAKGSFTETEILCTSFNAG